MNRCGSFKRHACAALALVSLAATGCAPPDDVGTATDPLQYPSTAQGVRFERAAIVRDAERDALSVDVSVRNTSGQKVIGIRASIDGGAWIDVNGTYAGPLDPRTERWHVAQLLQDGWRRIEFAVFFRDSEGVTHWDNNGQRNFVLGADDVVHRVGDALDDDTFTVDLDVRNVAYDKQCWVLASSSSWTSSTWITASYVGSTDRPGVERWRATLHAADPATAYGFRLDGAGIDYVATCTIAGAASWDNNHDGNYRADRVTPPDLRWTRPFIGAQRAVLADDGTAFVVSSEQWLSIYGPDGSWRGARDLGAFITGLEWLPNADMLLVRAGEHLTSLSRDGTVAWSTTSVPYDAVIVYGDGAEYLVARPGAALLGTQAPIFVGATNGCEVDDQDDADHTTFPVVTPSGKLACKVAGGVATFDVASGTAGPVLAIDGYPYAATDDALIVRAADRRTLSGYTWTGAALWTRDNLYVANDASKYGWGRHCGNHAIGDLAVYLDQDPAVWDPTRHGYVGVEIATGDERFRALSSEFAYGACPDRDGAFWATHTPYKYGWSADRVSVSGALTSYPVASTSRVFTVARNGAVARREWPYAADRGRLVVSDAANHEIVSRGYFGGAPENLAIAAEGPRVLVIDASGLSMLSFE